MTLAELLDPHQRAVAERVLAEEGRARTHIVVYLSGAHAYGFPSPDSDLDLKAIHLASTDSLLGLRPPRSTFDRAEVVDEVEIDYTSNEIGHALSGILRGNGNFLERVLGTTTFAGSRWLEELRPLVRGVMSRRFHAHYRGFAANQMEAVQSRPSVKALLYVLRTLVSGIHLLESTELVTDLSSISDQHGLADARELIAQKRAGERVSLDAALAHSWTPRIATLFDRLDEARDRSPLPEEPARMAELDAWLVSVRRS